MEMKESHMEYILTNEEIRILGCLIEKEIATPDYYPLSMNALVNACNQKSNREPVVSWDEEAVMQAIDSLKEKKLVWQSNLNRVPKYEEFLINEKNLINREAAILCILMLRGPQTAGEIRGRTHRLFTFENLEEVNNTIENLINQELVEKLSRQPGRKEVRYSHSMSNNDETKVDTKIDHFEEPLEEVKVDGDRIAVLEDKVAVMSVELAELKEVITEFKRQFE
jgi:uncharacterized protein